MTKFIQRRFVGGELDPALYSGTDLAKYATGAKTLRNMIVKKSGGVQNRNGSKYVMPSLENKKFRSEPFLLDSRNGLRVEFSNQKIRIFQGTTLQKSTLVTLTAVTAANPALFTFSGFTAVPNDTLIELGVITGMASLNGIQGRVKNSTGFPTNTFNLEVNGALLNSTSLGPFTAGTFNLMAEFTVPYLESELMDLDMAQDNDRLVITHRNHPVCALTRSLAGLWSIMTYTGLSVIPNSPQNFNVLFVNNPGGMTYKFALVQVFSDGSQSTPALLTVNNGNATLSPTNYISLGWNNGAIGDVYHLYQEKYGIYGLVAIIKATSLGVNSGNYVVIGVEPDTTESFITPKAPFPSVGNYPGTVNFYQQRPFFANTFNRPQTAWGGATGWDFLFYDRSPGESIKDTDPIEFTLKGRSINPIQFIEDLGGMILFTDTSEMMLMGAGNGIVTPSEINPKAQSYNGTDRKVRPIKTSDMILYLSHGSVRDLSFSYESETYRGNDLSLFAQHLFEGHQIVSWCFQKKPNSIAWAVREDGVLLSMTYVREQQIFAWTRHDMQNGFVEQICCIPEDGDHALYVAVRRVINGNTVRYVERISSQRLNDVVMDVYMDSYLSYNGTNTSPSSTMTISGGTTWSKDEELTLASSAGIFTAGDVGNEIHFSNGSEKFRFEISGYTNANTVLGRGATNVPSWARNIALSSWARAVDEVSGLDHLEGQEVSILGDGHVVASPNNPKYSKITVTSGKVTLNRCFAIIHVGLPYVSDLETLSIDNPQGETVVSRPKLIQECEIRLKNTRGIFVGTTLPSDQGTAGLYMIKPRNNENMNDPNKFLNGLYGITTEAVWEKNGSVCVRQVDPLACEILSITPVGVIA